MENVLQEAFERVEPSNSLQQRSGKIPHTEAL